MMKKFLPIILIFAVLLSYSPGLNNEFLYWDDIVLVGENRDIQQLSLYNVGQMFSRTYVATYIPLTILSFALEYQIAGLHPFLYHLDNLLLHAGVVYLIYLLSLRLKLSREAAFWGALIFAVHPLNVESVVWISERKDLLYAVFFLLSMTAYIRSMNGSGIKYYGLSLLFGLLSMLAKPMAYSLPLVLMICDFYHGGPFNYKKVINKIPFFLVVFGLSYLTLKKIPTDLAFSLGRCLLIWSYSFSFFIRKFLFPFNLSAVYEIPEPVQIVQYGYALSVIVVLLFLGGLIYYRKNRFILSAGLFYAATISMVVVSSAWDFGSNTAVADRFMYLPKLGFCLLAGYAVAPFFQKQNSAGRASRPVRILIICLLLGMGLKTYRQCDVWQNNEVLWTHVQKTTPGSPIGYVNRGTAYLNQKQYDLALADYEKAEQIKPDLPKIQFLKGNLFLQRGDYDKALASFKKALAINENYDDVYFKMGVLFAAKGELLSAENSYLRAIQINPRRSEVYYNLGIIYDEMVKYEKAVACYTKAIDLEPRYAEAFNNRGFIFLKQNRYQEAMRDFNLSIAYDAHNAGAYNNRGTAYYMSGDYARALEDFDKAVNLDSGLREAVSNRDAVIQLMRMSGR